MLSDIVKRKTINVIGLNSGTSADGLDLAALAVVHKPTGCKASFLHGRTVPYPDSLARVVKRAVTEGVDSIDEYIILDRRLGQFYAEQTKKFITVLKRKRIRPDLIASHGQTIRHLPGRIKLGKRKESGTLQIGHPETIASVTGILTTCDFRQADIGSGGEGAPITSGAMWHLLSSKRESRLLVNIGGIANYFYFSQKIPVDSIRAGDCGPGNSLLDIIAGRLFGCKFDINGQKASRGRISRRLITLLLSDNFLKGKYGPSTGRERFGERFVDRLLKNAGSLKLSKYDILATTAELTAITTARKIGGIIKQDGIKTVHLFGGGVKNRFLLSRLEANLPGIELFSVDRLGYNADYLEAACYALMGAMTVWSMPINPKHVTAARSKTVAGRIIQPPPG